MSKESGLPLFLSFSPMFSLSVSEGTSIYLCWDYHKENICKG